jgi:hypothetical protein
MVLVRRPPPWHLFAPSPLRDFLAATASDRVSTPWFLIILDSKDGKILAIREDGSVGLTPEEGADGSRSKIKAVQSVDRHGGRTVPIMGITAPSPLSSRGTKSRVGRYFVSFLPAVSKKAARSIRIVIWGWRRHWLSDKCLLDLSRMFNPLIRGWINYYGSFYMSALYPLFDQLNCSLKR